MNATILYWKRYKSNQRLILAAGDFGMTKLKSLNCGKTAGIELIKQGN